MEEKLFEKIYMCQDDSYIIIKNNEPYHIYYGGNCIYDYLGLADYIYNNNIEVLPIEMFYNDYPNSKFCFNALEIFIPERNQLLLEMDQRVQRFQEQKLLGIETTDSEDVFFKILHYKQYLRDLPVTSNEFREIDYIPTFEEFCEEISTDEGSDV